MNASTWVAVLGVALSAALTVGGWVVGHLLTRLRTADELVSTMRDTIADLKGQRDRLQITAEIQDRFFSSVPKQLPPERGTP